jgi:flagellar biosynthesis protein FlhF
MKITRHTAKDMRQALRLVRDQLGPEAVILTSKRTPFGVEVTAAIDFDAARVEAQARTAQAPPAGPGSAEPRTFRPEEFSPPAPVAQPSRPSRPEHDPYTIADRADADVRDSLFARIQAEMQTVGDTVGRGRNSEVKAVQSPAPARAVEERTTRGAQNSRSTFDRVDNSDVTASQLPAATRAVQNERRRQFDSESSDDGVHAALESAIDSYMVADEAESDGAPSPAAVSSRTSRDSESGESSNALGEELKAMRRILETQMAQLAWNDLTRRAPIHTEILRELTEVGLTQEFAAQIVAQLPAGTDLIKARRLSISLMATRLNVTGDRWLDKGGRIALVGPTGVGKTTALAKLAVRWVLRHGARSLALISADGVRIGAHDQLQALGQMIDVPVHVAESLAEIPKLLEQLGQKRFVLIDTPGMSHRDPQLAARMAQLASLGTRANAGAAAPEAGHGIETSLVLSASTQAGTISETVARYAAAKVQSVLLTKVDEAASLGGVLSVLARTELPISYVSEGQRVPEDLRPARSLELVSSAVQLAKSSGAAADEDLLRRRYGEVAHALA